jgi:hypothetical protein
MFAAVTMGGLGFCLVSCGSSHLCTGAGETSQLGRVQWWMNLKPQLAAWYRPMDFNCNQRALLLERAVLYPGQHVTCFTGLITAE